MAANVIAVSRIGNFMLQFGFVMCSKTVFCNSLAASSLAFESPAKLQAGHLGAAKTMTSHSKDLFRGFSS